MNPNGEIETLDNFIEQDNHQQEVDLNRQLTRAFMGKNADKFLDNKFSVWAFLFSSAYCFYRKMWLLGIAYSLISSLVNYFLGNIISYIVTFIASIALGACFKRVYLEEAAKRVSKIKEKYSDKSPDELKAICRRKGGTTLIPHIIIFILIVGLAAVYSFGTIQKTSALSKYLDEIKTKNDQAKSKFSKTDTVGNLEFIVPSGFTTKLKSDNYAFYAVGKSGEDDYCYISATRSSKNVDDVLTQFNSEIESWSHSKTGRTVGEVAQKTINGVNWYYALLTDPAFTGYGYSAKASVDNGYYLIQYTVHSDKTKICEKGFNEFINSVKFK